MRLTKLDIQYDPTVPDDWQAAYHQQWLEENRPVPSYYKWLKWLPKVITKTRRCTGGFDPYSGHEYYYVIGRRRRWELQFFYTDVISFCLEIRFETRFRRRLLYRTAGVFSSEMSWPLKLAYNLIYLRDEVEDATCEVYDYF